MIFYCHEQENPSPIYWEGFERQFRGRMEEGGERMKGANIKEIGVEVIRSIQDNNLRQMVPLPFQLTLRTPLTLLLGS